VAADPLETAEQIPQVAPEDASVGMKLVDDYVAEVLEQLHPLRVVGQDAGVEHVRIRDHDVPRRADDPPDVAGGVAVVGVRLDVHIQRFHQPVQLRYLVLRERLGREQVEGAGLRLLQDRVQDGDVVTEGLARGSWRDDHHISASLDVRQRLRLVGVEGLNAPISQHGDQPRVGALWKWSVDGLLSRQTTVGGDPARKL